MTYWILVALIYALAIVIGIMMTRWLIDMVRTRQQDDPFYVGATAAGALTFFAYAMAALGILALVNGYTTLIPDQMESNGLRHWWFGMIVNLIAIALICRRRYLEELDDAV